MGEIKGIKVTAPVFDPSGYAEAARQYIIALHEKGIPITIEPISFDASHPSLGETEVLLNSLVNKDIYYNVKLMILTPEHYPLYKEKNILNVGYSFWETSALHKDWPGYINNNVQLCLVPCEWNKEVYIESGVTIPVKKVHLGVYPSEFKNIEDFNIAGLDKETFMFYSISQWTERKNFSGLIKSYWSSFQNSENVALVLKTYKSSFAQSEKDQIKQLILYLKQMMPMYNYPKIYLLLDLLSKKEMLGLHKIGNCYVSLDRGEGWGMCVDGKTKILTQEGIKHAKDISKGDLVMSCDGMFHDVTATTSKKVSSAIKLSTKLHENTIVSKEHPFLIVKGLTKHKRYTYSKDKIESLLSWVPSGLIELGDYVAIPKPKLHDNFIKIDLNKVNIPNIILTGDKVCLKNGYSSKNNRFSYKGLIDEFGLSKHVFESAIKHIKNNTVPSIAFNCRKAYDILIGMHYIIKQQNSVNRYININDDVLRLFGWYLAEGSSDNNNRLEISLHKKEHNVAIYLAEVFKNNFGVNMDSIKILIANNSCKLLISNKIIASFFSSSFGRGSHNKHIPWWLIRSSEKLKPLITSLFQGDGYDTGSIYILTTVSASLAYQTKMVLSSLGMCPSIKKDKKTKGKNFGPYRVSISNMDYVNFTGKSIKRKQAHYIETDSYFLVKVTKTEEVVYNKHMYDFCVRDGKSFVGNGLLLHNSPFTAGAAGNPIIVTGCGGVTEYTKKDNSYLVDYTFTPVSNMPFIPWYNGYGDQWWAEPDLKQASNYMKYVYNNREEAKEKGLLLKKNIETDFEWGKVVENMIKYIKEML